MQSILNLLVLLFCQVSFGHNLIGLPRSLVKEYDSVFVDCDLFKKLPKPLTSSKSNCSFNLEINTAATDLQMTYEWLMVWKVRGGFQMMGPKVAKFNICEMQRSPYLTLGLWDFARGVGAYIKLERTVDFHYDPKGKNAILATQHWVKHYTNSGVTILMKKPTKDDYWSQIEAVSVSPDWKFALISSWLDVNQSILSLVRTDTQEVLRTWEGGRYEFSDEKFDFNDEQILKACGKFYSVANPSEEIECSHVQEEDDIRIEAYKEAIYYSKEGQKLIELTITNSYWTPVMMKSGDKMLVGNSDGTFFALERPQLIGEEVAVVEEVAEEEEEEEEVNDQEEANQQNVPQANRQIIDEAELEELIQQAARNIVSRCGIQ